MIASSRGIRLTGSSSFASIGIDSLGAVLFLREVSYKFGGIRIDPKALYSAGVTIKSFARSLYNQLKETNPEILKNLSLSEESDSLEGDKALLPSDIYNTFFQKAVLSNIRLLEGARGVFAFMVLWEHVFILWARQDFNNPRNTTTLLGADTFCFFVISGFITSIQLYESPQFASDSRNEVLKQRGSFKWKSFMYSRILGLYPIYWCALLLMIPWWKGAEEKFAKKYLAHPTGNEINWCRFSSVIAQSIWLNPDECWASDWFFFTGALINCFAMYSIIRIVISRVQDKLMQLRDKNIDSTMSTLSFSKNEGSENWSNFIGNFVTKLSYNRLDAKLAIVNASISFAILSGFEIINFKGTPTKKKLQPTFFITYFLFGSWTASVFSTAHFHLYRYLLEHKVNMESFYDEERFQFQFVKNVYFKKALHFIFPRRSSQTSQFPKDKMLFYFSRHAPDLIAIMFLTHNLKVLYCI
jgi:hypothetical protein